MRRYPKRVEIQPPDGRDAPVDAEVRAPGSKSITNRALVCAALADGTSELGDPLASDDTEAMSAALEALGIVIESSPDTWRVHGRGGNLRAPAAALDARASGTTARFLTAIAALADGVVRIDGSPRMRERPIRDLTDALSDLGVQLEVFGDKGCPPVEIRGHACIAGGRAEIDASRSSQFVSALLLAAPMAQRAVELRLGDIVVSRPYIDLTLAVMRAFEADAAWTREGELHVAPRPYRPQRFAIEPDASAVTYPLAAAAISGGRIVVPGVPEHSAQGDFGFADLLVQMGCRMERREGALVLMGPPANELRGVDLDLNAMPDTVLTLAVVALFATSPTRIRNVGNLRIKESDRLTALENELQKLGADVESGVDELRIRPTPGRYRGAHIETYDDHRVAMALALAGLRIPDVVIEDPGCVAKTWPDYWDAMAFLGARPA